LIQPYSCLQSRRHYSFFLQSIVVLIYGAITLYGVPFQATLTNNLRISRKPHLLPLSRKIRLAFYPFRSLLLRVSLICFLFLPLLRCFNSRRIPSLSRILFTRGFSHSEIPGSNSACESPGLIAACHVLHRYLNQAIHLTASTKDYYTSHL
jgi:hypothetical protein